MKILIPSEIIPTSTHNVRSGNIVLFNIIQSFLKKGIKIELVFLNINRNTNLKKIPNFSRNSNFKFSGEIRLNLNQDETFLQKFKKIFFPRASELFPILNLTNQIKKKVETIKPDWIFLFWSEKLTHLFANTNYNLFAYYGNPIPKNLSAHNLLLSKYKANFYQRIIQRIYLFNVSRIHLNLMKNVNIIGNIAKNDALYYKNRGHKNSFYIQNTWFNKYSDKFIKKKIANFNLKDPIKIAANLGKLNATANTFGLIYLFEKLVPKLIKVFKDKKFELHLFGSEKPEDYIPNKYKYSEVKYRGFVDQIDEALMDCPIFLCCNNATLYNVGHTRYLHAWTLGRCVIAHSNVRLAMPEIKHNKNALLGKNSKEIAQLIYKVSMEKALLKKISIGGFNEFKKEFNSDIVVDKILNKMKHYQI